MAYAQAEKAASAWQAYAARGTSPPGARGATPLPAHVGIVAAYLSSLAGDGRKACTIGRRAPP
jgi:hypothetical protein